MAIFMALEVQKEANWLNQDPVIESNSKSFAEVEAHFLEEPFLCRRRWSCEEDKAPWLDGFIVRFYKVFWEDVKGVLLKVYRAFHTEGKLQGLQTSLSPH
ncbi:hypothetical protein V6N11_031483 [Hibiscus sabdariffa]|uniref:Uncharacterized protein n=1 Tax=Hibiscus sabdariffa TaxID=183260 RepID=A0ABR2SXS9_9ROSI